MEMSGIREGRITPPWPFVSFLGRGWGKLRMLSGAVLCSLYLASLLRLSQLSVGMVEKGFGRDG